MGSEQSAGGTVQNLEGLEVSMAIRNWDHGDGVVHRYDDAAQCGNAPGKRACHSDLETTRVRNKVVGGLELCPACDWPDGASEVFNRD